MTDASAYPNLVDRALRFLEKRSVASEAELCAHLFGLPERLLAGPALAQWSRILLGCLGGDPRFVSPAPRHWALRSALASDGACAKSLDALEFVALAIASDGPKPWRDRVVGIAAVRAAGSGALALRAIGRTPGGTPVLSRWESVTSSDRPRRLPSYLRELGLGAAALEGAPTFAAVADDLLEFLGDLPIVGVDVGLSVAYLQFELRRAGHPPLSNPLIDLVTLAGLPIAGISRRRARKLDLDFLAADLGVPPADRRSLASLARLSADVGHRLLASAAVSGVATLAELRAAMAAGPEPASGLEAARARLLLDRSSLESFPTDPGAYLFLDTEGRVHYVGKATSLRARLAAYLAADLGRSRRMAGVVEATAQVRTETTATELEALLLEARLIERHQPLFNVQRRSESELIYLMRSAPEDLRSVGRRVRWAQMNRACSPGCLGPIPPADGGRLLAEARQRYRLGGQRGTGRWLERAAAAWEWLAEEVDRTAAMGDLTARDLGAFALIAPWPPEPVSDTVEAEPEDEEQAIGHEGWIASGGDSSQESGPDSLEGPSGADDGAAAEEEGPGSGDQALLGASRAGGIPPTLIYGGPQGTALQTACSDTSHHAARPRAHLADEAGAGGGTERAPDPPGERRVVVLGKAGWLGSLTVGAAGDEEITRRALDLAESVGSPTNPSAAAELAVALRFAASSGARPLLLRRPTSARPSGA